MEVIAVKVTQICNAIDRYLTYLQSVRNLSFATLEAYRADLSALAQWAEREKLLQQDFNYALISRYLLYLHRAGLANNSINRHLSALKGLLRFLISYHDLPQLSQVHSRIKLLKSQRHLPQILTPQEIATLLPVGRDFRDMRDRSLVELLYSTGCRISELTALNCQDLDIDSSRTTLQVRGKGARMREVYLGNQAHQVLQQYLPARAHYLTQHSRASQEALLVNLRGERLTRRGAQLILHRLALRRGLPAQISPHTFRHSFATHILDNGADIRSVQELLGHARISTTQIYTQVGIAKLKRQHAAAHPHGNLRRSQRGGRR